MLGTGGVAGPASRRRARAAVTVTITDRDAARLAHEARSPESTKFVVLNKGKKRHVFAIAGPGVKGVKTGKIAPASSATLTVKLQPGAYVLSDPVGLGTYTSAFLDVIRATDVSGTRQRQLGARPRSSRRRCAASTSPRSQAYHALRAAARPLPG